MNPFLCKSYFCSIPLVPYSCDICDFVTDSKVKILTHSCETENYKNVSVFKKCGNCYFGSFSSIWRYFHSKKCAFLEFKSIENVTHDNTNKSKLRKEIDVKQSTIFKELSEFEFQETTSIIENNLQAISQLPKFFECDKCSYKSLNHSDVIAHFARKHIKMDWNKKFRCSQCHHKTSNKYSLGLHIVYKHTPDEFINWHKCHLCVYKSKYHHGLKHHLEAVHPGKRKPFFRCDQCDYTTRYKVSLIKHTKRKHSTAITKSSDTLKLNIKPFERTLKINNHISQIQESKATNKKTIKKNKISNKLIDGNNLETSAHEEVNPEASEEPVIESLLYMGNFIIIELFQCSYCDVHLTSKGRLHIHILSEHSIDEDIINVI